MQKKSRNNIYHPVPCLYKKNQLWLNSYLYIENYGGYLLNRKRKVKKMTIIPASKKLRVAIYCRVSTTHKDQLNSLSNQISYYNNLVGCHPNWGLYIFTLIQNQVKISLEEMNLNV